MREIAYFLLPAFSVQVFRFTDWDLFYFGDAWLEAHAGARQAVTGPVFLMLSMFMCWSDVDVKCKRQTVYLGEGLKPGSPATVLGT